MYTLRTITKRGEAWHKYLGKEYIYIQNDCEGFKDAMSHFKQKKEYKGSMPEKIIALIIPETRDRYIPVYNEPTYILNERGELFCDINGL